MIRTLNTALDLCVHQITFRNKTFFTNIILGVKGCWQEWNIIYTLITHGICNIAMHLIYVYINLQNLCHIPHKCYFGFEGILEVCNIAMHLINMFHEFSSENRTFSTFFTNIIFCMENLMFSEVNSWNTLIKCTAMLQICNFYSHPKQN